MLLDDLPEGRRANQVGPIFAGQAFQPVPIVEPNRPPEQLALNRPKRRGTEILCCMEAENRSYACLELVRYFRKGVINPKDHFRKMMAMRVLQRSDMLYILEKCADGKKYDYNDYLVMDKRELYRIVWTMFLKKDWRASWEAKRALDQSNIRARSASQLSANSDESIPDEEVLDRERVRAIDSDCRFDDIKNANEIRMKNNLLRALPTD